MYSCLSEPISQTSPPPYSTPPAEASLATSCVRINSERGLHPCWRPSDTLSLAGGDCGRLAQRLHRAIVLRCRRAVQTLSAAAATHLSAQSSGTSSDMVSTPVTPPRFLPGIPVPAAFEDLKQVRLFYRL